MIDLLGIDRMTALTKCVVRLSAVFAYIVAALLVVEAAPAFAEETISHRPEGIKEHELIAHNYGGTTESEPEFNEPPGYYVENAVSGDPGGGDGVFEYTEECEHGNIFEHCEGLHTVINQNSEGTLPSGFVKLEHTVVDTDFEGYHGVANYRYGWKPDLRENELFGPGNPGERGRHGCLTGKPVNCATGNETQTQTDLSVGGRGPALRLTPTYNSRLAMKQATPGQFGFGWTGSYSAHLELSVEGKEAVVYQDNGSTVTFARSGSGEPWIAPTVVQATLADEGSGYVYTLPNQTALHFNSSGRLTSEVDRDGNTLTMSYETEGRLTSVSDAAGRKIMLVYNAEGEVESAKDPMGHVVKYAYESGNLTSVTLPGEEKASWKYKYNSEHELTSETDGREHTLTIGYNEDHQVVSQTDAMSRKRTWEYATAGAGTKTTITEPNGASTVEQFNEYGSPTSVTRAAGTPDAATTAYEYNSSDELTAVTDADKHKTEYGYDSAGNRTSQKDAGGDETKWTYDSTDDVNTETKPDGETTTIKRDAHGNPEVIERPAPGSTTQKTIYKYAGDGDVESVTDPLEHTWKYEYDAYGDRTSETDPEGDKRTWEYNEDSQMTATVSPRGNALGAEASKFTTKVERDAQGRPLVVTGPDADGTSGPADKTGAFDLWLCAGNPDAQRRRRRLGRDAISELCLPVAALQHLRRQLHQHLRRHRCHVCPHQWRCRHDASCRGYGDQLLGLGFEHVCCDSRRHKSRGSRRRIPSIVFVEIWFGRLEQ
jgi:YD repeat-containing protein